MKTLCAIKKWLAPALVLLVSAAFMACDNGTTNSGYQSPPPRGETIEDAIQLTADTWESGKLIAYGEQWFTFSAGADTQYLHFHNDTLPYIEFQLYNSNAEAIGLQDY